eukprot:6212042-Pleurochrysis_carterae.AAC.4
MNIRSFLAECAGFPVSLPRELSHLSVQHVLLRETPSEASCPSELKLAPLTMLAVRANLRVRASEGTWSTRSMLRRPSAQTGASCSPVRATAESTSGRCAPDSAQLALHARYECTHGHLLHSSRVCLHWGRLQLLSAVGGAQVGRPDAAPIVLRDHEGEVTGVDWCPSDICKVQRLATALARQERV